MGSGADDAHMADQDVEELGQFVEVAIAKETAHPGDPGIVVGGLFGIGFRIDAHGPEFEAWEGTSQEAYACLHEEDRPFRIKFYENIKNWKKPAEDEKQDAQ